MHPPLLRQPPLHSSIHGKHPLSRWQWEWRRRRSRIRGRLPRSHGTPFEMGRSTPSRHEIHKPPQMKRTVRLDPSSGHIPQSVSFLVSVHHFDLPSLSVFGVLRILLSDRVDLVPRQIKHGSHPPLPPPGQFIAIVGKDGDAIETIGLLEIEGEEVAGVEFATAFGSSGGGVEGVLEPVADGGGGGRGGRGRGERGGFGGRVRFGRPSMVAHVMMSCDRHRWFGSVVSGGGGIGQEEGLGGERRSREEGQRSFRRGGCDGGSGSGGSRRGRWQGQNRGDDDDDDDEAE
mmetsp:Transcript_12398/g.26032  ORF Transcript_12398/g.26032 Transcript_12398/m.26032 type:complete len:288 (-) Transcript_12398:71-934(-)